MKNACGEGTLQIQDGGRKVDWEGSQGLSSLSTIFSFLAWVVGMLVFRFSLGAPTILHQ